MDSMIAAAARALAGGDALTALQRVALRDDPPALALRGIAMAQLGEHPRARELLRRAASAFGAHEPVARARCVVAEAEVALAQRDLGGDGGKGPAPLLAAAHTLQAHGDTTNALQARLVAARRLVLLGRLAEASALLAAHPNDSTPTHLPAPLAAVAALTRAELALRALHINAAHAALQHAERAAQHAGVPALQAEVAHARALLAQPAARLLAPGGEQALRLQDVAALRASGHTLVVDACRHAVHAGGVALPLARRPVLFALVRALAQAWPGDVDRDALIASVFRTRHPDETHRARLRVEMGRLRKLIAPLAGVEATARGFVLRPVAGAPWPCWHRRWMANRARCWRCSPTARPGPHRPWHWRWATASALCSARWPSWKATARCAPSARPAPAAGWPRRWWDSRRSCYSPPRSQIPKVATPPTAPPRPRAPGTPARSHRHDRHHP